MCVDSTWLTLRGYFECHADSASLGGFVAAACELELHTTSKVSRCNHHILLEIVATSLVSNKSHKEYLSFSVNLELLDHLWDIVRFS